ncbi:MAG: hypothetical protein JWN72_61 [Thermoleophilia bacterium]|nr:hypothetical protein [Thermoleophilia bacterium]
MSQETGKQRVDRELMELLNEIRVALPGVQLLFGFLLAVPFQQRFGRVDGFQRDVYFTGLCLTLVATMLLIAPSAYHRLNFRARPKHRLVQRSNALVVAGLVVLAAAMTSVMLLVADVLFARGIAVGVACATGAAFGALWIVGPLIERAHMRGTHAAGDDPESDEAR